MALNKEKAITLFDKFEVLSKVELKSRIIIYGWKNMLRKSR